MSKGHASAKLKCKAQQLFGSKCSENSVQNTLTGECNCIPNSERFLSPSKYQSPSVFKDATNFSTPMKFQITDIFQTPTKFQTPVKEQTPNKFQSSSNFPTSLVSQKNIPKSQQKLYICTFGYLPLCMEKLLNIHLAELHNFSGSGSRNSNHHVVNNASVQENVGKTGAWNIFCIYSKPAKYKFCKYNYKNGGETTLKHCTLRL